MLQTKPFQNETLKYYDQNADSFAAGTVGVAFTEIQDRFLSLLPPGGNTAAPQSARGRKDSAMNQKGPKLYEQLNRYCRSDAYPFHMPGHKRRTDAAFLAEFPNPYGIDITEIDGFDNLHHAEGILKESMEWAASVYGTERTYYLVNGSTCGVLAAICAAARPGGTVLMARNSHKSAYHAADLHNLNIRYVYPQMMDEFGLQGGILPEKIEKMLITCGENGQKGENGRVSAVFITSPTYDGVVSDVRGIAEVCHRYGVPLIVDEAHGAHFPFGNERRFGRGPCPSAPGQAEETLKKEAPDSGAFPVSALYCGADVVIHSLHKTLPSFTQTALLHICGERVDVEKLEYYLQVFQTSSPSYVMMAGIERCIEYMAGDGRREMGRFAQRLERLRASLSGEDGLRQLRLLDRQAAGAAGAYDLDASKILVSARFTGKPGIDGSWLAGRLRKEYHLEMEMCGTDYVTAIATLMDTEEGLERLRCALLAIDRELDADLGNGQGGEMAPLPEPDRRLGPGRLSGQGTLSEQAAPLGQKADGLLAGVRMSQSRAVCSIHEALCRPAHARRLEDCEGRISGEYVYLYPPGIPILTPGEVVTQEILDMIEDYRRRGLPIQGLRDHTARELRVIGE